MACPLLIFSQSDYLIRIVAINSHTKWQTVQVQISWLLQKPTDLDLHCLQRQGISGFSMTRVNIPLFAYDKVVMAPGKALFTTKKTVIFFLILPWKYMLWILISSTSNEYPQHMFSWRNKKNIIWIPPPLILICEWTSNIFSNFLAGWLW